MSLKQRQKQFEEAIKANSILVPGTTVQTAFGVSNAARVEDSRTFLCGTANLERRNAEGSRDETPVVIQAQLKLPPGDEVHFALVLEDAKTLTNVLARLAEEARRINEERVAQGVKPGKINNNVRFYLRDDGLTYLTNAYVKDETAEEGAAVRFDPGQAVPGARILFAVWPPAASQRRSGLVREFTSYIGGMVGSDNVHELRVWTDADEMPDGMRRLPADIPISELTQAVEALGGHYPKREVQRLHAGLNFHPSKHFVILSGLSGTGKTQLAVLYAKAVHAIKDRAISDRLLVVCPVRPDWTDPTGLTGHNDVLSGRYVVPPFLEAVLLADMHPGSPVFVILDELNLARVEYYLSDVLSAMETGEPLQLHESETELDSESGFKIRKHQRIPENLYIIGTINVDETTSSISDKVLDRSVVIDMSDVDLQGYLTKLAAIPQLGPSCAYCAPFLQAVQSLLQKHGSGFGYRIAKEVIEYHAFSVSKAGATDEDALDELMIQKILIKLRGSERQSSLLIGLASSLSTLKQSAALIATLQADLDEYGSFQAAR